MNIMDYLDSEMFTPAYGGDLPVVKSDNIDRICRELYYAIKNEETIFIYGDYDMDGFAAANVWGEILSSLYHVPPVFFRYVNRMHSIDPAIVDQAKRSGARVVIICDSGSGIRDREVVAKLRMNGHEPIVIDHHNWEGDYESSCIYNLIYNSHEENELLGGAEISGAYASLLVGKHLCDKYFQHSLSFNAMIFALASMYSDCVDLATAPGRALYNIVQTVQMPGPLLLSSMNKWNYSFSRRFFSFIVAPPINACFRIEEFGLLNSGMLIKDKYLSPKVSDKFYVAHKYAKELVELLVPVFNRERYGNITVCVHAIVPETRAMYVRNFSGLIANRIAQEEKGMAIVVIKDGKTYEGSYRDFYNRKMLSTFRLFCVADGHDSAFGLSFSNLSEFTRHIQRLSETATVKTEKDYEAMSSRFVSSVEDVQALAVFNEYRNVRPKILLSHKCSSVRLVSTTRFRRVYDVGLPYNVSCTLPIMEGANLLIEPMITKSVELRAVE